MNILEEKNVKMISCGDWTAYIAPEVGMNVICVRYKGEDVLFVPKNMEEFKDGRYCQYGVPLTLPPNRTAHGVFSFEGIEYKLAVNEPQHDNNLHGGDGMQTKEFTLLSESETEVTGEYVSDCKAFPFPYKVNVLVKAEEDGIKETITITNTGSKNMPLAFGVHSVFVEKPFSVPIAQRRVVNEHLIPTGELANLSETEQSFTNGTFDGNSLIDTFFIAAGRTAEIGGIKYTVSDNFDNWVIWNGDSKSGFVALEPLQGAPNALNTGDGLLVLAPGESEVYTLTFSK